MNKRIARRGWQVRNPGGVITGLLLCLCVIAAVLPPACFPDAGNGIRVTMIACHPDDENTALLSALAGHGFYVRLVFFTRGEEGRNLVSGRSGPKLGEIRCREALKAAGICGVHEVLFLPNIDFGFTTDEAVTAKRWDGPANTARLAQVIRETKPHILIIEHHKNELHGQHAFAVGTTGKAVQAAGDPEYRFPENRPTGPAPGTWKPVITMQRADAEAGDITFDRFPEQVIKRGYHALQSYRSQGYHRFPEELYRSKIHRYRFVANLLPVDPARVFGIITREQAGNGLPFWDRPKPVRTEDFLLSLQQLGFDISPVEPHHLGTRNREKPATVIIGENAYFKTPSTHSLTDALEDYVRRGGTCVVMAQLPDIWNSGEKPPAARGRFYPETLKFSPYRDPERLVAAHGAAEGEAHTSGAYTLGAYTSGAHTSGAYTSGAYTSNGVTDTWNPPQTVTFRRKDISLYLPVTPYTDGFSPMVAAEGIPLLLNRDLGAGTIWYCTVLLERLLLRGDTSAAAFLKRVTGHPSNLLFLSQ